MPQPRKDALTSEQIEMGRSMREHHGKSWYAIANALNCDSGTIRRAIEPGYAEYRRGIEAKRIATRKARRALTVKQRCDAFKPKRSFTRPKPGDVEHEATPEERNARSRATRQDDAFINAMTIAVNTERETCPIGVDTRPSTANPRFTTPQGDGRSVTGSSAQMCADFA